MSTQVTARPRARATLGLVLVVIGVVLALESAGVLKVGGLARWWPLFLIGVGTVKLRQPLEDGQRSAGVALLFLGGFFQFVNLLAGAWWPLLMIGVGAFLLWQAVEPSSRPSQTVDTPVVNEMALMGYSKRAILASAFRGGSITAVMGGVELDLRRASLAAGPAQMDVFAFWGGIELKVPPGWTVDARVVPIMGGFESKAELPTPPDPARTLVLRGHAVMGAVVVGN